MTSEQRTRRKQRLADTVGVFLGIMSGLWVDSDDLWPRAATAVVVGLGTSVLLRLALRVPLWRSESDQTPPGLPPYGQPPVG